MKATLIRISTQEILRKSVEYPSVVIEPIESLEEDLKWLLNNRLDKPEIDETTHKLVRLEEITEEEHPDYPLFHQFRISFIETPLSEEELDDVDESESSIKYSEHLDKGEDIFQKTYKRIWKRRNKQRDAVNKLTQVQARNIMEWLQPVYLWLQTGNFHQARKEVRKTALETLVTEANIPGITKTYNDLKQEIEDYFDSEQYDL